MKFFEEYLAEEAHRREVAEEIRATKAKLAERRRLQREERNWTREEMRLRRATFVVNTVLAIVAVILAGFILCVTAVSASAPCVEETVVEETK